MQGFTVLCTSITLLWTRTCNYCLWPFDQHVRLLGNCSGGLYVCVQNTMVEGTCIMKIQSKGDLFPEAIFIGC